MNEQLQTQEMTNVTTRQELTLMQQAMLVTKQTEPSYAQSLIRTLAEQAMVGTVTWQTSLTYTISEAVSKLDQLLSKQVTAILHHCDLQKLEGSWRGLHYLVKNTLIGPQLKIRVMNVDQKTLARNLEKAMEFDQSDLFKKVYEEEYGTPGGNPYGLLVADYQIGNSTADINFIENLSGIASAAFCPVITAAAPSLIGLDKWEDLAKPRDLTKVFESPEFVRWNSYRDTEDARFVTLTLPQTLARLPYGKCNNPVEAFDYEELPITSNHQTIKVSVDNYCWMNTSYVFATRITNAFAEFGWCTAIRGAEGGGKVSGLPMHTFMSDDGDIDLQCPTQIGITDRREAELSRAGFLPLSHYKGTDYAVFFGGQTTQKPKRYDDHDANANAEISARLPYLMATSRIAHYLKVMARDKIGSFLEIQDAQKWLNAWILNYVNSNQDSGQILKSRYPLADAKIEVHEVPGKPGSFQAIAWLRPWLQLEELTTSLRLVANIPTKS